MRRKLSDLEGATVQPDGSMVDQQGHQTGMSVSPGGFMIFSTGGRRVGTLSRVGRVYDQRGNLVAQVSRNDHRA